MQITLRQAMDAFPALQKLNDRALDLKVAWRLSGFFDEVKASIERYQRAANAKSAELGLSVPLAPDADDQAKYARAIGLNTFNRENEDLLDTTELTLTDAAFTLTELGDAKIQAGALTGLRFLIKE